MTDDESEKVSLDLSALVVEGNPINMQVVRLMLTDIGCNVVEASNGQEALSVIAECHPDIVFMSCQMPVMDGCSASRIQRALEAKTGTPRVPIVAVTDKALAEDREKCIDAGMDDFVCKPFRRKELINAIQRVTGNSGVTSNKVQSVDDCPATPAKYKVAAVEPVAPAIDRRSLDQINDLDPNQNGELLNSIIDTYCESTEALMLELMTAAREQDLHAAVRVAHSLKSSSASVGAQRLADLCHSIERQGGSGDISAVLQNIDSAWIEYRAAVDELVANKTEVAA